MNLISWKWDHYRASTEMVLYNGTVTEFILDRARNDPDYEVLVIVNVVAVTYHEGQQLKEVMK